MAEQLILIGGGGHASDLLAVIESCNRSRKFYDVVGIFDDNVNANRFKSRSVLLFNDIKDNIERINTSDTKYFSAIGYPEPRLGVAEVAGKLGLTAANPLIHPAVLYINPGVRPGPGTVVHAGVGVNVGVTIGSHCYLSHGALIGHDSKIADGVSIMPGASLSGDVTLGRGVMVGSGAVILEGISVGDWSQIGANAVVTSDVPPRTTVVGIPARRRE